MKDSIVLSCLIIIIKSLYCDYDSPNQKFFFFSPYVLRTFMH